MMRKKCLAQSTIEFTFAMVTVAVLIYGLIKVFQWTGMDYAEHSWDRENTRALEVSEDGKVAAVNMPRTKRLNAFTRLFLN